MRHYQISELVKEVLFTKEEIQLRIAELAKEIEADYKGKDVVFLSVLKGSIMIMTDLTRCISTPYIELEFVQLETYHGGLASTGEVEVVTELKSDITGKELIIVEDILDSGITLEKLCEILAKKNPKSIEILAFLRKPMNVKVDIVPKYIGFDVDDKFLVGYGLDVDQKFRNLEDVVVFNPDALKQYE
ncbi:MAG: hypoxanthine phosphoribosyltransferase [Bifidobacteriaceae bacterium]|jgi:hypoxanthine phosphoribosyltransferase|nr:hypoxanthine phosphoribosyltransferase [Bifidobacteriaceae bacterium]